jgi:hypothetical protein
VRVRVEAMTAATKTGAFQELRGRLNEGSLELYAEPTLLGELRRLKSRYVAGRAAVEVPRIGGSHGDLAQALALATWELRYHRKDSGRGAGFVRVSEHEWAAAMRKHGYEGSVGAPLRPGMSL